MRPVSYHLYLLPITYYLLPITYYLLLITYYLLPITYNLLLNRVYLFIAQITRRVLGPKISVNRLCPGPEIPVA